MTTLIDMPIDILTALDLSKLEFLMVAHHRDSEITSQRSFVFNLDGLTDRIMWANYRTVSFVNQGSLATSVYLYVLWNEVYQPVYVFEEHQISSPEMNRDTYLDEIKEKIIEEVTKIIVANRSLKP